MVKKLSIIIFVFLSNALFLIYGFNDWNMILKTDYNNLSDKLILNTENLPNDMEFMPTIGNGHLGFTIYGEAIYLNGIYNGKNGLSHRARIPNYSNLTIISNNINFKASYSLNIESGIFRIRYENSQIKIIQLIFAHRYYTRSIINQINIYRKNFKDEIILKVIQKPGQPSKDIEFSQPTIIDTLKDINSKKISITNHTNEKIYMIQGFTKELENEDYQKLKKHVCGLWNHVPEEITLPADKQFTSFRFVMTADELCITAEQEMIDVLKCPTDELINSHRIQWLKFWDTFQISVNNNSNLEQIINSGLFYIGSSLPSFETNQENNLFFGLGPTGLGRGGSDIKDYQGHSFWDTEIWMFPVILQMDERWAKQLLDYRYRLLPVAKVNAQNVSLNGSKFPWESAFTGTEVTQPCCPLVAKQQLHITADIGYAIRNYYSSTHDIEWLSKEGCTLIEAIADFWVSRADYNNQTDRYDIKYVMGPDEDHENIANNVFTNVVVSYVLKFAVNIQPKCKNIKSKDDILKWLEVGNKLQILYDNVKDYHPQYEGYQQGTIIKQADAILLGYPLLYRMKDSTRRNNLEIYGAVTRSTGPAMTWSMHSINYLDINNSFNAAKYFEESYKNYVRPPFQVWSEVIAGNEGAKNFLTGTGGFLQSLINGYAGIRIHLENMEIKSPHLPPYTNKFVVSGIKYLGSRFEINIEDKKTKLKCLFMNEKLPLQLFNNSTEYNIFNGFEYLFGETNILIKLKTAFN